MKEEGEEKKTDIQKKEKTKERERERERETDWRGKRKRNTDQMCSVHCPQKQNPTLT
jgi:hypothetical protein